MVVIIVVIVVVVIVAVPILVEHIRMMVKCYVIGAAHMCIVYE